MRLSRSIRAHREGILAAVELGLANSKLEGLNSKIRLINHRGYGHHSAAAVIAITRTPLDQSSAQKLPASQIGGKLKRGIRRITHVLEAPFASTRSRSKDSRNDTGPSSRPRNRRRLVRGYDAQEALAPVC